MGTFEIYPAIDLIDGEVVRLMQGDPQRKTVYRLDPVDAARRWMDLGAKWLHVVNLDGALETNDSRNLAALHRITMACGGGVNIQFGGGLRTMTDLLKAFETGITRAVLGTAAVESAELLASAVRKYGPDRIAVGLDAADGTVRTRGWAQDSGLSLAEVARQVLRTGVKTVIYTNIAHDGMGTGVDTASAQQFAGYGFDVIASGGAASLADIQRVRSAGLTGVIIGKALYDGRIDLGDAIQQIAKGD